MRIRIGYRAERTYTDVGLLGIELGDLDPSLPELTVRLPPRLTPPVELTLPDVFLSPGEPMAVCDVTWRTPSDWGYSDVAKSASCISNYF